jgi:SNF2 family DNA or RNA helicase
MPFPLLSDDQAEAVKILCRGVNLILAFGTGTGKTMAGLASFEALRQIQKNSNIRLVVVGTNTSMSVWENHIKKYTDYSCSVCYSTLNDEKIDAFIQSKVLPDVLIVGYSGIVRFSNCLKKLYKSGPIVLIIDEAHHLKNYKSDYHKHCKIFSRMSYCTWLLTATPALNKVVEDIYTLVNFVFPGALGKREDYLESYTVRKLQRINKPGNSRYTQNYSQPTEDSGPDLIQTKIANQFSDFTKIIVDYKNLEDLNERIKPYMMIRYKKFDVNFNYHFVDPSPEEFDRYIQAASGLLGLTFREFAARIPDLQLVVDGSAGINREPIKYPEIGTKEKKLIECVTPILDSGNAVIVFSYLRLSIDKIKETLSMTFPERKIYLITGSTPTKKRGEYAEQFSPGDIMLITGAGGESLNLQCAGDLVMYNLPFSVAQFVQVAGRIIRMDSKFESVNIHIIESSNTVDSYKRLLLQYYSGVIQKLLCGNTMQDNPNLPKAASMTPKDVIVKLRKTLLWKTKGKK